MWKRLASPQLLRGVSSIRSCLQARTITTITVQFPNSVKITENPPTPLYAHEHKQEKERIEGTNPPIPTTIHPHQILSTYHLRMSTWSPSSLSWSDENNSAAPLVKLLIPATIPTTTKNTTTTTTTSATENPLKETDTNETCASGEKTTEKLPKFDRIIAPKEFLCAISPVFSVMLKGSDEIDTTTVTHTTKTGNVASPNFTYTELITFLVTALNLHEKVTRQKFNLQVKENSHKWTPGAEFPRVAQKNTEEENGDHTKALVRLVEMAGFYDVVIVRDWLVKNVLSIPRNNDAFWKEDACLHVYAAMGRNNFQVKWEEWMIERICERVTAETTLEWERICIDDESLVVDKRRLKTELLASMPADDVIRLWEVYMKKYMIAQWLHAYEH